MNGKECRATRREIDESDLNQRLSEQARSHVASCSACRGFHAERTSLRELVGSLEPVAAPGDFDLRLRARMASERSNHARQPFIFRFVIGTPAIAAAALVVLLAVSLVWFAQHNRTQAPNTASNPPRETPAVPDQPRLASKGGDSEAGSQASPADVKLEVRPGRGSAIRDGNNKSGQSAVVTDYGVAPAEYVRQGEQRAGEVSLSAPLKPMVVSIQDDHGATRRISLPPVSFGAQRLVDNRIPVSATNSRSW